MVEVPRSRKRLAVSCTLCRKKKIRCNRETPCNSCIKSKKEACTYETQVRPEPRLGTTRLASIRPRDDCTGSATAPNIPLRLCPTSDTPLKKPHTEDSDNIVIELKAMRARIIELEDKLSRANSTSSSPCSAVASTPASTRSVRTVSCLASTIDVLQDTQTPGGAAISRAIAHKNRVFGQSHWMNGFVMFRELIEIIEHHLENESSGIVANLQRAKVLARVIKTHRSPTWPVQPSKDLPSRLFCDQLVAAYLRTVETMYRILHVPSFQLTYERLWKDRTEPSMSFVIMLKLVLAIGALVYDDDMSLRTDAIRWVYEAQIWLSLPTFKSQLGIEYLQSNILLLLAREMVDVGSELVWISAGAVYRAAVYIGLHKDPSELPRMTVLEAEVRRRVWNTILELSLQMSLLAGGPPLFSEEGFNTAPPGNFDDEQLLEPDPVARPEHVYTQTSIAIALRGTLSVRLAILKFLNEIGSNGTYKETLRIDGELKAACKAMRRTLHGYAADTNSSPSPFALQMTDFILQRYAVCLHLPFYGAAVKDPMFAYSRKAAVESSLRIWASAHPVSTDAFLSVSETDLARLCRCGSGFFRAHAFHAALLLANEWRVRLQDEEDDTDVMSSSLSVVAGHGASWFLRCLQAGETSIKGYFVLRLLEVWADAIKGRNTLDLSTLLMEALQQAVETCLPILETAASSQEQRSSPPGSIGLGDIGDFDRQFLAASSADWDTMMLETFNLNDLGSFDAFMP